MAEENSVDFLNLFTEELGVPIKIEKEEKSPKEQDGHEGDQSVEEPLSIEAAFEAQNREKEKTEKNLDNDEVKEESQSKAPEPGRKDTEDTKDSPTLLFARFLSEQGHLASFDEQEFQELAAEKGEEDALAHLWNKEASLIRDEIIDTYDADVREFLELKDKGVDPKIAFDLASGESLVNNLTAEDLEEDDKEDLRRDLITQKYKLTTKFSNEKIKKLVDRAFNMGEDVEEALESVEDLKAYYKEEKKAQTQNVENQKQELERQKEESLKTLQKKIEDLKEVIPGVPLTATSRKKLLDKITKPVGEVNGQPINALWQKRLKDPIAFDIILAELDSVGVFDGKWDKVVKKVKSDTVNKLRQTLKEDSFKTRSGAFSSEQNSGVEESIRAMKESGL